MGKRLSITPDTELASKIDAAAAVLRIKPEGFCALAARQVADHVLRHESVAVPIVMLPPGQAPALRRAAITHPDGGDEVALAASLVEAGLNRFATGEAPVFLPASIMASLRAAFAAVELEGGLEGFLAKLVGGVADDLIQGDAEGILGAYEFDSPARAKAARLDMIAAARAAWPAGKEVAP